MNQNIDKCYFVMISMQGKNILEEVAKISFPNRGVILFSLVINLNIISLT